MVTQDYRRLRGLLAEHGVTHKQFAAMCGLNRVYLGRLLAGRIPAGELARIKIERGLQRLGLVEEARRAS